MSEITLGDDYRAKIASSKAKKEETRSEMMDVCRDFDGFRAKKEENYD
jgi:hypothetical protein